MDLQKLLPYNRRPESIDGHLARGPWASSRHDFLARHEHEPSTKGSGPGRHGHDVGLVLGFNLSP
jgi:hypothetical protein